MHRENRRGALCAAAAAAGMLLVLAPDMSSAASYEVDPEHTSVIFKVRHLFTQVHGRFDRFSGTISFDPSKPEATRVQGTIDVASVNTNVTERDADLRSERFFEVSKHPEIRFASTKVSDLDAAEKSGKLHGNLTIRGVERPVALDVVYLGEASDPWGNRRGGFTARTKINRKDFGLTWNEVLETGGVLVGDEVEIEIHVEGTVVEE